MEKAFVLNFFNIYTFFERTASSSESNVVNQLTVVLLSTHKVHTILNAS